MNRSFATVTCSYGLPSATFASDDESNSQLIGEDKPTARRLSEVLAKINAPTLDEGDRVVAGVQIVPVEAPAAPQAGVQADDVAIVSEVDDDGISWFDLAVRVAGQDSWQMRSLYSGKPRRNDLRDDAWVMANLAPAEEIAELAQHLDDGARDRLVLQQREALEPIQQTQEVSKHPAVVRIATASAMTVAIVQIRESL